jgi:hypothetical protein
MKEANYTAVYSAVLYQNLAEITKIKQSGKSDTVFHGRICYGLITGYEKCFLDLSFMPVQSI